MKFII